MSNLGFWLEYIHKQGYGQSKIEKSLKISLKTDLKSIFQKNLNIFCFCKTVHQTLIKSTFILIDVVVVNGFYVVFVEVLVLIAVVQFVFSWSQLNKFFDPSTPSMRKGRKGRGKK